MFRRTFVALVVVAGMVGSAAVGAEPDGAALLARLKGLAGDWVDARENSKTQVKVLVTCPSTTLTARTW